MRAYNQMYVEDGQETLGEMFEYLVCNCGIDIDFAYILFINSGYAELFEQGNPYVLSGISGIELGMKVIDKTTKQKLSDECYNDPIETEEYWIGSMLAYYQWRSGTKFVMISHDFMPSKLYDYLPTYQNESEEKVFKLIQKLIKKRIVEKTKLRQKREEIGMSQSELARQTGVNIRNIQLYEQRKNDIDKAQGNILYKLAMALKCNIEDILENPVG